jgi:hypothetical protein
MTKDSILALIGQHLEDEEVEDFIFIGVAKGDINTGTVHIHGNYDALLSHIHDIARRMMNKSVVDDLFKERGRQLTKEEAAGLLFPIGQPKKEEEKKNETEQG